MDFTQKKQKLTEEFNRNYQEVARLVKRQQDLANRQREIIGQKALIEEIELEAKAVAEKKPEK